MTSAYEAASGGPYTHAADLYWNAGWRGVLPLPVRAKKSPPTGWTGASAPWPSYPDLMAWSESEAGNIALRMPHHVIGIDVDQYDGKTGGDTLSALERAFGALPATWRTTSRDDGVSGIRLYRVPEGAAWPGDLGAGIEVIQWRHRYALVWPSLHPEGRTYRWVTPDGTPAINVVPSPDDLPDLPQAWIDGLTSGRSEAGIVKGQVSTAAARSWLTALPDGPACRETRRALERYRKDLTESGRSRHEVALTAVMRLVRLAAEGHDGTPSALLAFRDAWTASLAGSRSNEEADSEWARLVEGAIAVVHDTPVATSDPCINPFAGLIKESSWPSPQTSPSPGVASPGVNASPSIPTQGRAEASSASRSATPGETSPPGASGPAGAATSASHDLPPEGGLTTRTSWWPKDLEGVLSGAVTEPGPTHLVRTDGQALFYAGKTNGIIGESESGKTFVAVLAVLQAMADHVPVTFVDFEDTAAGVVTRLRDSGASDDQLRTLFSYIGPDESLDALATGDLQEHLLTAAPGLIVLDGVNAAMTLLGLDLNSNTDATAFAQRLLRPLATTGACVIYIDHVPKSKDNETKGGIGAQAKRAMTTGCTLRADVVKPFGRGQSGKLRLTVDKDRPGHVRGASGGAKVAGTAVLTSDAVNGTIALSVEPPEGRTNESGERQPFRPTQLMEKVSAFLANIPDGATTKAIETEVYGNASAIRAAIARLVEEGYVRRQGGARGSLVHHHIKPYSDVIDLVSSPPRPTSSDLVSTSSGRGGESRPTTSSTSSPPYGDEDEVSPARGVVSTLDLVRVGTEGEIYACHGCGEVTERSDLYAGLCKTCRRA